MAYVAGEMNLGQIAPALPQSKAASGTGSSVNNPQQRGFNRYVGGGADPRTPAPGGGMTEGGIDVFDPGPWREDIDMPNPFEPPDIDDETLVKYQTGQLGGPDSPFQIGIAYHPEDQWKHAVYMLALGQAFIDALKKFEDGDYTYWQVVALATIARAVLAREVYGIKLPGIYNLLGGLTEFGAALLLFQEGQPIRRIDSGISMWTEEDEAARQAEIEANEAAYEQYWEDYHARRDAKYQMEVLQNQLMTHTTWERIGYHWQAIKEVASSVWNSPVGKVAGVVAFAVAATVALAAGLTVAAALVIGGIVGLAAKLLGGTFDVRTGGVYGDLIRGKLGTIGMLALDAAEFAWMTAAAWGLANLGVVGALRQGQTIYRVYGGVSPKMGRSWSAVDPRRVFNYAGLAGLPIKNLGTRLVIGRLVSTRGVVYRSARRIGSNLGGLPEVYVPNPKYQIVVLRDMSYRAGWNWRMFLSWWY